MVDQKDPILPEVKLTLGDMDISKGIVITPSGKEEVIVVKKLYNVQVVLPTDD